MRAGQLLECAAIEGIPSIIVELLYWYRIDPLSAGGWQAACSGMAVRLRQWQHWTSLPISGQPRAVECVLG
jgi:hypothetical protein